MYINSTYKTYIVVTYMLLPMFFSGVIPSIFILQLYNFKNYPL